MSTKEVYLSKHFTYQELACRRSGKLKLAIGFLNSLEALRIKFAQSMIVTSCCRSTNYNKKIGGVDGSFHICDGSEGRGSCAIDIYCTSYDYQFNLLSIAWSTHWSIGLYHNFLHLDRRSDYTSIKQTFFIGR